MARSMYDAVGVKETVSRRSNLYAVSSLLSMPGQLEAGTPAAVYQLDWADPPPELLMKDWRTLLGACAGSQAVRKALELERAHFALGLTLWFILLWETEWFGHVCSCAFRCVLFAPDAAGQEDSGVEGASADDAGGEAEARYRREHVYAYDACAARASTPKIPSPRSRPEPTPCTHNKARARP
ncbi:hypothetical protein JDV02_007665 [Purpureocillium takamizusanense]|uniref:Uncharacterized protein n=1 Tax=Purpureocillium takamizusanense TaxID=2060973 RepID=A0A9Q8QNJ8_9HYPO|nr:uncharacterized protein JDV02_007665 [Purpureocillium takamizusanense]UNI21697.1 hypothetical protein JDV02_007665 [Purpureocillium takamizusanense]